MPAEALDTSVSRDQPVDPLSQATSQRRPAPGLSVVRQVIEAARHAVGGDAEIQLDPVELGRVHMALGHDDGRIVVTVTLERADTMDLMRRHMDSLARDLRELGYDRVDLAFGRENGSDPRRDGGGPDRRREAAADAPGEGTGTAAGGADTGTRAALAKGRDAAAPLDIRI